MDYKGDRVAEEPKTCQEWLCSGQRGCLHGQGWHMLKPLEIVWRKSRWELLKVWVWKEKNTGRCLEVRSE